VNVTVPPAATGLADVLIITVGVPAASLTTCVIVPLALANDPSPP
jgi:hypothetical protein